MHIDCQTVLILFPIELKVNKTFIDNKLELLLHRGSTEVLKQRGHVRMILVSRVCLIELKKSYLNRIYSDIPGTKYNLPIIL